MWPSEWTYTQSGQDGEQGNHIINKEVNTDENQGSRIRESKAPRIARSIPKEDRLHWTSWLSHAITR